VHQTRARLAHRAADPREIPGRAVLHLAVRVERDGEALLELFRGRIDA